MQTEPPSASIKFPLNVDFVRNCSRATSYNMRFNHGFNVYCGPMSSLMPNKTRNLVFFACIIRERPNNWLDVSVNL